MPAIFANAPGKAILFGEHAVVYGQPAIAIPVSQVQAKAVAQADIRGKTSSLWIDAPEIGLSTALADLPSENPLAKAAQLTLQALNINSFPAVRIRVTSTIPVASGLGSGAAVTVAFIRCLSSFLGRLLPDPKVSEITFEVEKIYHGTPSGIDNTVVTYAKPIYFTMDRPIQILEVAQPLFLVIADTGIYSPTAVSVGEVREAWQKNPAHYDVIFTQIGEITRSARLMIEAGEIQRLGPLMDRNQELLTQLGVSSPELDHLVATARTAGAWGAKLSGGGRGGNMLALVNQEATQDLADALQAAGARRTVITRVEVTGANELLV